MSKRCYAQCRRTTDGTLARGIKALALDQYGTIVDIRPRADRGGHAVAQEQGWEGEPAHTSASPSITSYPSRRPATSSRMRGPMPAPPRASPWIARHPVCRQPRLRLHRRQGFRQAHGLHRSAQAAVSHGRDRRRFRRARSEAACRRRLREGAPCHGAPEQGFSGRGLRRRRASFAASLRRSCTERAASCPGRRCGERPAPSAPSRGNPTG